MLDFDRKFGQGVVGKVFYKYKVVHPDKPILVMFGSLNMVATSENIDDPSFEPWCYRVGLEFLNVNVLCFISYEQSEWFMCGEFHQWLGRQKLFLDRFPCRIGYGASMGAFGVSTFYHVLGLNRVLLLNPISTLSKSVVPWERRPFGGAADNLDWEQEYSDSARNEIKGVVVVDPLYDLDRRHARRYKGLHEVFLPGVGHQIPKHLVSLKLLKGLLLNFVNDEIDFLKLRRSLRSRRYYHHYYEWLLSSQNRRMTSDYRKSVVLKYQNINKKYFNLATTVHGVAVSKIQELALNCEEFSTEIHDQLLSLVNSSRPTVDRKIFVDTLRDCALVLGTSNVELSIEILELALSLRPNGPFLNRKLNELRLFKKQISISEEN